MNTIEIEYGNRKLKYKFANSWEELKEKNRQYIAEHLPYYRKWISVLYGAIKKQNIEEAGRADGEIQKLRILLFAHLADVNLLKQGLPRTKAFLSLENDQMKDILETVGFVFKEIKPFDFPITSVNVKGETWFGPSEKISVSLTGEEFSFLEMFFGNYMATKQRKWLYLMLATLYRPEVENYDPMAKDFKGDRREIFNRHNIEARSNYLKKTKALSEKQVAYILLWWEGSIAGLKDEHPNVFTKGAKKGANKYGWLNVFRSVGKGMLKATEVAKMSLGLLLTDLEMSIEENEKQQRTKMTKV